MSLIRTGMSLALQSCCRREHDSAKRRASASLRNVSADLIQTDFSLPILDTEHHGGSVSCGTKLQANARFAGPDLHYLFKSAALRRDQRRCQAVSVATASRRPKSG
jgi:hypothetical protein